VRGVIGAGNRALDRGSLEASQGGPELLIGAAIDSPAHGAKKSVKGEGDQAVARGVGLMIASHQLDVDVLVERARKALTGGRQNTPPSPIIGYEPESAILGRVAESKHGHLLEPFIEEDGARRCSAACDDGHTEKVDPYVSPGKLSRGKPQDLAGNRARCIGTQVRHCRADIFALDVVGFPAHGGRVGCGANRRRSKNVGSDSRASFFLRNGQCEGYYAILGDSIRRHTSQFRAR
jgi:hypothetical protein